jgi:BirA family transcriptional regulator, biotin operon repressor / biotin---[acetyl-CoA-carboxylase] ligase
LTATVRIIWHDELRSTQDEARRLASLGETGPIWIAARRQTAGRGRRGRAWTGIEGNLFATGLFSLEQTPVEAANLSFAAALAVAETVDGWVDPAAVQLKWPNDVLIHWVKTSGILLESWQGDGRLCLLVGIGINLAAAPEDTERPATCLARHLPKGIAVPEPGVAMLRLAERFELWLNLWRAEGFAPVRAAWLQRAAGVGAGITARLPLEEIAGRFRGLDQTGALELEIETGAVRTITAGDVFFTSS